MRNAFATELGPCVSQVLETMFFTSVLSCSESNGYVQPIGGLDHVPGVIDFHGPPDGKLCLCCSREAITALSASFLGVDESEVSAKNSEQVAGELANMICGSVLSRCAPKSLFRLEESKSPACQHECDTSFSIEIPEGLITICARVDRL